MCIYIYAYIYTHMYIHIYVCIHVYVIHMCIIAYTVRMIIYIYVYILYKGLILPMCTHICLDVARMIRGDLPVTPRYPTHKWRWVWVKTKRYPDELIPK